MFHLNHVGLRNNKTIESITPIFTQFPTTYSVLPFFLLKKC